MRASSRRVHLTNGFDVATPLLIPSLSSKGFPLLSGRSNSRSEVEIYVGIAGPSLVESLLISAYDIYYNYLPGADQFRQDFFQSIYARPKLLVIDSGGY